MDHQDLSSYLAPYACDLPRNTAEHKVLQTKLFSTIRNPRASEAAKDGARFMVLCLNIRLILKIALGIAAKPKNRGVEIEELLQVGQMAMYKAMQSFDHTRGTLIISYAQLGIERAMERACSRGLTDTPIQVPSFRRRQMGKVKFAMSELEKVGQSAHDAQAILDKIHEREEQTSKSMTLSDVKACLKAMRHEHATRLNAPVNSDSDSRQLVELMPGDQESPEGALLDRQTERTMRQRGRRILDALEKIASGNKKSARNIRAFRIRYGLDGNGLRSLKATGDEVGLTRERVRQIMDEMLRKLSALTGLTIAAVEEAVEAQSEGLLRQAA